MIGNLCNDNIILDNPTSLSATSTNLLAVLEVSGTT